MMRRRSGNCWLFGTEYTPAGGGRYTSHVWARSRHEADHFMRLRQLGEVHSGWADDHPRASVLLHRLLSRTVRTKPGAGEVEHALIWLAHVSLSCHEQSLHDVTGDQGWLHEAVHWVCGIYDYRAQDVRRLVDRVAAVERRVPGMLPGG